MISDRRTLTGGLGAVLAAGLLYPTARQHGHADATPPSDPFAWVDSIVDAEAIERGVPGVAVAIVADGRVLLQRGYGVADLETGRAVNAATPFNIASLTKPFTAALAAHLAEDGRVGLDDSLGRHLPELAERYHGVTLRQLLTHTSGVDRDLRNDNDDDPGEPEYRARLDTASVHAAPGARWEYANNGYTLLGWALSSAAGESLDDLYARYIFDPLGMRQARYRQPLDEGPYRARPYTLAGGEAVEERYVSGGFASGGLVMSIADLAAFAAALQGDAVLSPTAKEEAWSPARLADGSAVEFEMMGPGASYGFGWFLTRFEGRRLVTHGGGIEGFSANFYHFPEEGLSIVALANAKGRDDGRAPVDPLARALARSCLELGICHAGDGETRDTHAALDAANRAFSRAYLAGDMQALADAYAASALVMPPRGRLVVGNGPAARRFTSGGRSSHLDHALYPEWRLADEDRALEAGTWYDVWLQEGDTLAGSGRYVLSWMRTDGTWRMTTDAWQLPGETRDGR